VIQLADIFELVGLGLKYYTADLGGIMFVMAMGTLIGLIFGCIPGLTAALAVTLLLPFTYAMTAEMGISLLIALYVGGVSGGIYAASLLNIPGTPGSLVTIFDAYPLAKQGYASLSLTVSLFSSFVGGIFSFFVLISLAPQLSKIALMFGYWEYFAMGILGLCVVVSFTSGDTIKGLIGTVLGSIMAMVGMDPLTGLGRFTFGQWQLSGGLPLLATLMGFFAICEIFNQMKNLNMKKEMITLKEKIRMFPPFNLIKQHKIVFLVSAIIGTWIGILPGIGQSTGSLVAYNQVKQMSKTPEKFGNGAIEGVMASETANNAVNGGALIPMITLGIPGDLVTSILLGGLIIHGLQPGPMLFRNSRELVGVIFVSYFFANILMLIIGFALIKFFIYLLRISASKLFPIIMVMCVLGTFTVNNRIFDVWILLAAGIIGYILTEIGFKLPPIILGYILSPIIEHNFRTGIINSRGSFLPFITRPISAVILVLALILLVYPAIVERKRKKFNASTG